MADCSEWHKKQNDLLEETPVNQDLDFTKEEILVRIANIDDKFKLLKALKKPKAPKKIDEDDDFDEDEEEKPKEEPKKKKKKEDAK